MPVGAESFDIVTIGSGFANSFFLKGFLARRPGPLRVLVLERGPMVTHAWQTQHRNNSPIDEETTFRNRTPRKEWRFNIGFGGGSNCWTGHVPRMLPVDFRMRSTYGVGRDWPLGYDDLEPFYEEAEAIMAVSGPATRHPYPKRGPYPQPPHRLNRPDQILQKAQPDWIFELPTVRARVATATRGACCANGVCSICPVDAKFTILNGMADLYADPRITLLCEAEAIAIETAAGRASAVRYCRDGREYLAKADIILLGANGIFNPTLMLRSGFHHPQLGHNLHEQGGFRARVYLGGVDNFQGSSYRSALNYALYDGPHRRDYAACMIEHANVAPLRPEFGRWRQVMELSATIEDLPDFRNMVLQELNVDKPTVLFLGYSDYYRRGSAAAKAALDRILSPLPVEHIEITVENVSTKSHIQGTTVMGTDARDSVIDRTLRHHQVRNLFVLGSGAFPTGAPANPTLTISALSLWAAAHA